MTVDPEKVIGGLVLTQLRLKEVMDAQQAEIEALKEENAALKAAPKVEG